ncbi:hypothetical protein, partial [Streptococcus agalactiae]|uniref:hypothetical protein n=1 Tax=Streptococcus agalactiae TaxID=1311 RepID=UPI001A7E495A
YLVSYRGAPIPLRIADKDGGADRSEDCAPMEIGRQGRNGAADEESEVEAALAAGAFPPCSFSHQLTGETGDLGNALHSGL